MIDQEALGILAALKKLVPAFATVLEIPGMHVALIQALQADLRFREDGAVLKDIVADQRSNPVTQSFPAAERIGVAGAPVVTTVPEHPVGRGWRDGAELTLPPGTAMIDRALPGHPGEGK
jgi:hypothetical protein